MKLPTNITNIIDTEIENKENEDFFTIEVNENNTSNMYYEQEEDEKFVKYIEKIIRSSFEYNRFIGILKTEMDLTKCKFLDIVDITLDNSVPIEMHHYPLTLFDIVMGYREKLKVTNDSIVNDTFKIAEDVMKLHYEGKIGIVPLSQTAHELAHNGDLFLPLNSEYVYGNWEALLSEVHLTEQLEDKITAIKEMTVDYKDNGLKESNENLFKPKGVQIEMEDEVKPMKIVRENKQLA